jgi:hypothetical protein
MTIKELKQKLNTYDDDRIVCSYDRGQDAYWELETIDTLLVKSQKCEMNFRLYDEDVGLLEGEEIVRAVQIW